MIPVLFFFLFTLDIQTSAVPAKKGIRTGRYAHFDADDMFLDLFDEMQDPFPDAPRKPTSLHNFPEVIKTPDKIRPFDQVNTPKPLLKKDEKIFLFNHNKGKFELIPASQAHASLPLKPTLDNNGLFFYGGQHFQYGSTTNPTATQANKTEEIKIFWSSLGDAIESVPFLPISVNVPDMISAMAAFFTKTIPLLNRFQNPNEPRPSYQTQKLHDPISTTYSPDYYAPTEEEIQGNNVEDRELKTEPFSKKNSQQLKKKSKEDATAKPERGTVKRIIKRPIFRPLLTSSEAPQDSKIWHQHGSQSGEAVKYKNMPITRKRLNMHDREVFNFKNSDISNSPIMILNMPHRPMMYYKIKQEGISKDQKPEQEAQNADATTTASKIKNRRKINKNLKKKYFPSK